MTYTHKTDHSFSPPIEFWRPIENLLKNYPYRQSYSTDHYEFSYSQLIDYFEKKTLEPFNPYNITEDIYGNPINQHFVDTVVENRLGRLISYLSTCIKDNENVYKFQRFFEMSYYYLKEINEYNPNNDYIKEYKTRGKLWGYPPFEELMNPLEFIEYFNSTCRKYKVPFVMFTQNEECYVVHITDIFIEKVILDLPQFLSHPDLKNANSLFTEAYKNKENSR